MSEPFARNSAVHVVGCGGAGMSGLVRLLVRRGCRVSGCDATSSATLRDLAATGATMHVGHSPAHLEGVSVVTASPAVPTTHVELVAARERALAVLSRADVMAELARIAPVVGFAGTHGKTTTTSMAAHVWTAARRDPSWLLGAPIVGLGANGNWRDDAELLVEVDESYGTFATLAPYALGVLAVDPDHLDFYGDVRTLERAFAALVERTTGPVAAWTDNDGANRLANSVSRPLWRVGRANDADVRVRDELFSRTGSSFGLDSPAGSVAVTLAVPGPLNVANAAVAAAVALATGIEPEAVAHGLGAFVGAPRRFQVVATMNETTLVDDYAHLPAEVVATVVAAQSSGYERIAAVFQPHRVTRTEALAPQFADAFDGVTELIVTDIYTAGEPNPHASTGELVADAVRGRRGGPRVTYVATLEDAAEVAAHWLGRFDLVLILGAGDVGRVIDLVRARVAS